MKKQENLMIVLLLLIFTGILIIFVLLTLDYREAEINALCREQGKEAVLVGRQQEKPFLPIYECR